MQPYNGLISQEKEGLLLISRRSLRLKKERRAPRRCLHLLPLGFSVPVSCKRWISCKKKCFCQWQKTKRIKYLQPCKPSPQDACWEKRSAPVAGLKPPSLPLMPQHFTFTIKRHRNELSTRRTAMQKAESGTHFITNSCTRRRGPKIIQSDWDQKAAKLYDKSRPRALQMKAVVWLWLTGLQSGLHVSYKTIIRPHPFYITLGREGSKELSALKSNY